MKQSIQVVTPDNELHAATLATVKNSRRPRINYNSIATAYNKSPVGSLLFVELQGFIAVKTANFIRVLEGRGLEHGKNFLVCKVRVDAEGFPIKASERPISIEKLDFKVMRLTR